MTKASGVGKRSAVRAAAGHSRLIPIIMAASPLPTDRFNAFFITVPTSQASAYLLMTRTHHRRPMTWALSLSLLLHLAPFVADLLPVPPAPSATQSLPPLQATLTPPSPTLPPAQPELALDKPAPPRRESKPPATDTTSNKPSNKARSPTPWPEEITRQFMKQNERGEFYPVEAIAQGMEGEVLVLMILDRNGKVVAARVEKSSGYRLLDDAALNAVRSLHALPADAPRETLLPVRFRLK